MSAYCQSDFKHFTRVLSTCTHSIIGKEHVTLFVALVGRIYQTHCNSRYLLDFTVDIGRGLKKRHMPRLTGDVYVGALMRRC